MKVSAKPAKSPGARERIVLTASRLFYREGIRATGIDKIIAESGVAKMSFYRHFPSKNDLIAEYLQQWQQSWLEHFIGAVEQRSMPSGSSLEVMADVLQDWFAEPHFRGCAIINAMAETAEPEAKISAIIQQYREQLEAFLTTLAGRFGSVSPASTASQLMEAIQGAIITAQAVNGKAATEACRGLLKKIHRGMRRGEEHVAPATSAPFLPGFE